MTVVGHAGMTVMGVCWDEGDGVRGDAAMSCFCFYLFLN
jgi:hypothetical protein